MLKNALIGFKWMALLSISLYSFYSYAGALYLDCFKPPVIDREGYFSSSERVGYAWKRPECPAKDLECPHHRDPKDPKYAQYAPYEHDDEYQQKFLDFIGKYAISPINNTGASQSIELEGSWIKVYVDDNDAAHKRYVQSFVYDMNTKNYVNKDLNFKNVQEAEKFCSSLTLICTKTDATLFQNTVPRGSNWRNTWDLSVRYQDENKQVKEYSCFTGTQELKYRSYGKLR